MIARLAAERLGEEGEGDVLKSLNEMLAKGDEGVKNLADLLGIDTAEVTTIGDAQRRYMAIDPNAANKAAGLTVQDLNRAAKEMEDASRRRTIDPYRGSVRYPDTFLDSDAYAALLLILMAMVDARSGFSVTREVVERLMSDTRMRRESLIDVRDTRYGQVEITPNGRMMSWVQDMLGRQPGKVVPPNHITFDDPPKKPDLPTPTGRRKRSTASKKLREKGQ